MTERLQIAIFGLSVTSSWGNGHATTYRCLMRGLAALGHEVSFFERDLPWYAKNRDLPNPAYGRVYLYSSLRQVKTKFERQIRDADLTIVGSYVPQGVELGEWVTSTARGATAFYDIDTPVTLAKLERHESEYISRRLVRRYDLYLSFTGGPTLQRIESQHGARVARPLYCSVDPLLYSPQPLKPAWDLGYMGTYSEDRQPWLEQLMLEPARRWTSARMIVAGPQYPPSIRWPRNVKRITHLSPAKHRAFYGSQKFTLNVTRSEMRRAGYSPSVRLFEAAACGTPIITDEWEGLDELFVPGREILISRSSEETLQYLKEISENQRIEIGTNARSRILRQHTATHRAAELERYFAGITGGKKSVPAPSPSRIGPSAVPVSQLAGN